MQAVITDQDAKQVIASNIRQLLQDRGMSQRQLAIATGDPVMTISNLLNAKHTPGAGLIARIAEAFEVEIDALFASLPKKSRRSA